MEIEYELSRDDYEHLTRRSFKERSTKIFVPLFLVLTAMLLLLIYPHGGLSAVVIPILAGMIVYALFATILIRYVARATYQSLKRSPSWGRTKVRLEPDALTSATYLIKSEIRWEAVARLAEDARGFYLYLNPVQVVMIPNRVFRSAEEAQAFRSLVTEYYQHAKTATETAQRAPLGR